MIGSPTFPEICNSHAGARYQPAGFGSALTGFGKLPSDPKTHQRRFLCYGGGIQWLARAHRVFMTEED